MAAIKKGVEAEFRRYRQGLGKQLINAEIFIFERRPQIPLRQLFEVVEILEVHRIIEVVFGFNVGHDRRRQIAFACERAARCEPHQEKRYGNQHQHGRDGSTYPFDDEFQHNQAVLSEHTGLVKTKLT